MISSFTPLGVLLAGFELTAFWLVGRCPNYVKWIRGLKDGMARIRLARRLDKAQRGIARARGVQLTARPLHS